MRGRPPPGPSRDGWRALTASLPPGWLGRGGGCAGEDALANVCLEKAPNKKVTGHIRIRSKTQGIALSLGDKITVSQKAEAQPAQAA